MRTYNLSERRGRILERMVKSGEFQTPEQALQFLIDNYQPARTITQTAGGIIDPYPALNGATHTQEQWISLYNSQGGEFKGKRLINAYDLIQAPKTNPQVLPSLQEDCRRSWIVTAAHNHFKQRTLAGDVIHNYLSTVASPIRIYLDEIPVLEGVPAIQVVENQAGLLYFRALANDMDAKPRDLLSNLETLTQRDANKILVYTPNQDSRNSYPERAVRFGNVDLWFHVSGDIHFDFDIGLSRGVSVNPRSGRKK